MQQGSARIASFLAPYSNSVLEQVRTHSLGQDLAMDISMQIDDLELDQAASVLGDLGILGMVVPLIARGPAIGGQVWMCSMHAWQATRSKLQSRSTLHDSVDEELIEVPTTGRDILVSIPMNLLGAQGTLVMLARLDFLTPLMVRITAIERSQSSAFLLRGVLLEDPAFLRPGEEGSLELRHSKFSFGSLGHPWLLGVAVSPLALERSRFNGPLEVLIEQAQWLVELEIMHRSGPVSSMEVETYHPDGLGKFMADLEILGHLCGYVNTTSEEVGLTEALGELPHFFEIKKELDWKAIEQLSLVKAMIQVTHPSVMFLVASGLAPGVKDILRVSPELHPWCSSSLDHASGVLRGVHREHWGAPRRNKLAALDRTATLAAWRGHTASKWAMVHARRKPTAVEREVLWDLNRGRCLEHADLLRQVFLDPENLADYENLVKHQQLANVHSSWIMHWHSG